MFSQQKMIFNFLQLTNQQNNELYLDTDLVGSLEVVNASVDVNDEQGNVIEKGKIIKMTTITTQFGIKYTVFDSVDDIKRQLAAVMTEAVANVRKTMGSQILVPAGGGAGVGVH